MVQQRAAAAFWSYVHQDDKYEDGRITRLRERLEDSIRFHSGIRDFRIFQDRKEIGWGERWRSVIEGSLEQAVLLFPVVTPSFFSSVECRTETLAFQARQKALQRTDLILPIYYFAADPMEDADQAGHHPAEREIAALLKALQFEDCRELRRTGENDRAYIQAIERMAKLAIQALKRSRAVAGNGGPAAGSSTGIANTQAPAQALSNAIALSEASPNRSPNAAGDASRPFKMLTVNQMPGRGDFSTITEAVRQATGGERILVLPGHYRENVVIDKPLELVGDGARDDIVIESDGPEPLVFDTNIGAVRNFTLRQTQASPTKCCVLIKQGRLELEDCDISSKSLACIVVINNSDPRVRRNRIHDGNQGGVFIYDQARGTYEDNEVSRNAMAGFEVATGADPVVRRNRINNGKLAGVLVHTQGRGTFEDNEVSSNGGAGFEVATGADPVVRRNRLHGGEQGGIFVRDQGRGTFEDNEVSGSSKPGIEVRTSADPVVRRNRLHSRTSSGIYVHDQGRGVFEDNDVCGNAGCGVSVKTGAHPTVRNNRITTNNYQGVWVQEGGAGVFEDNDLTGNSRGPWDIHPSAEAQVKRARNKEE